MSLRIVLIFAKSEPRRGTRLKHFMVPPHSLQLIAALTPQEHQVTIIDEYHNPAPLDLDADLIGISVWTASATRAYELADAYRRRGIRVVLGGLHVTICPEEAALHADAIVTGEAESVWPRVLQDVEGDCLQKVYHGEALALDQTPAADWQRINQQDYLILQALATTRGCVRNCDFCCESCRPKPNFRVRPLAKVVEELDARPTSIVAFIDNDILADRNYASELFKELIPRKLEWFGMTSITTADDEAMLDLMAASGCRTLFVGFESIDSRSLAEVNKRCNRVETYIRNIKRIHDRGIMVNGSFVFGFDHDTDDVFDKTVKFGIEACLETATFTILTPYPGTTLYTRLLKEGRIIDHDWSHYDTTHVVYQPAKLSGEQLLAGYYEAYRQFYSWSSILHRCRPQESGFGKRLLLNIAYKKLEPVYKLLARPLAAGSLRWFLNWYAQQYRGKASKVLAPGEYLPVRRKAS